MFRVSHVACGGLVWPRHKITSTVRKSIKYRRTRTALVEDVLRIFNANPNNNLPKRRHFGSVMLDNESYLKDLNNSPVIMEYLESYPRLSKLYQQTATLLHGKVSFEQSLAARDKSALARLQRDERKSKRSNKVKRETKKSTKKLRFHVNRGRDKPLPPMASVMQFMRSFKEKRKVQQLKLKKRKYKK